MNLSTCYDIGLSCADKRLMFWLDQVYCYLQCIFFLFYNALSEYHITINARELVINNWLVQELELICNKTFKCATWCITRFLFALQNFFVSISPHNLFFLHFYGQNWNENVRKCICKLSLKKKKMLRYGWVVLSAAASVGCWTESNMEFSRERKSL